MSRLRAIALNLLLLVVSFGLVAALLEGAARWYIKRVYVDPHGELEPMGRFNPVLGWDKNPGVKRRIRRAEYDVEIAFNSKGLRGPERDYPVPQGVRRILILGDSFAEGYYAEEDQTARAVLERTLNARGCGPVEVINGGTLGYSTDQEYLFYRDEGSRYGADLVLLFFYSNDLYHNTRNNLGTNRPKPMFYVDGEKIVPANLPLKEPPPVAPEQMVPSPWRGSFALRLLSDRTIDSAPRLHEFLASLGLVQRAGKDPSRELWPFGPANNKEVADMWERTGAILRALDAGGARPRCPANDALRAGALRGERRRLGPDPRALRLGPALAARSGGRAARPGPGAARRAAPRRARCAACRRFGRAARLLHTRPALERGGQPHRRRTARWRHRQGGLAMPGWPLSREEQ